jgi:hypothetical protein
MWRKRAARRATVVVTIVILAVCVLWAIAVQTLVPDACELTTAPPNAGPLVCPAEGRSS